MKIIIAVIVLALSLFSIAYSVNVVFLEEVPSHKYPALSQIEHSLLDYNKLQIQLKTSNLKELYEFAENRYLAEWKTKFILIIFSIVSSILVILVLVESKTSK